MTKDNTDTTEILGVSVSVCEQCNQPHVDKEQELDYCNECQNENVVPKRELEALADEWEETLEWARKHEEICSNEAINVGELKVKELREVLEE